MATSNFPQMPQSPSDLWQLILRILEWSLKIPLALLAVFVACCFTVIGFLIAYKLTVLFIRLLI